MCKFRLFVLFVFDDISSLMNFWVGNRGRGIVLDFKVMSNMLYFVFISYLGK